MNRLDHYWYSFNLVTLLLLPISWLFRTLAAIRRTLYHFKILQQPAIAVPVIIVGNISVGGTGKTPLVTWLCQHLKHHGYKPGIISRGYGGQAQTWPQSVSPESDAKLVGDEPIILVRNTNCPMFVGPDRVAAAQQLLRHHDCNIIIADDGLQHYRLKRDIEIVVIDGERRFGNNQCLPAGPLREPVSRLKKIDFIITNGKAQDNEFEMVIKANKMIQINSPKTPKTPQDFSGQKVHAVAGIGNPSRFFNTLTQASITFDTRIFPDHHDYNHDDLIYDDHLPIIMTEKDAVKCEKFCQSDRYWYLSINSQIDAAFGPALLSKIRAC